jgi:hypothetical protein
MCKADGISPALLLASRTGSIPMGRSRTRSIRCTRLHLNLINRNSTEAYTHILGLDDRRPIIAIVAFEGDLNSSDNLNFSGETGRVYFRVQAHLLRCTLLDVDGRGAAQTPFFLFH